MIRKRKILTPISVKRSRAGFERLSSKFWAQNGGEDLNQVMTMQAGVEYG